MPSAIYLLGKRPEVSEIFDNHILPYINQNGILVPDRTIVPIEKFDQGLLFSLAGENLEAVLSGAILNAFNTERQGQQKNPSDFETKWEYTLGLVNSKYLEGKGMFDPNPEKEWNAVYQRIGGPCSEGNGASKLFIPIALGYILKGVDEKATELEEHLSEIASTTLAEFGKR